MKTILLLIVAITLSSCAGTISYNGQDYEWTVAPKAKTVVIPAK